MTIDAAPEQHIHDSPAGAVDLTEGRTFAEIWTDRVSSTPDASFLVFEEEDGSTRMWSYGEFDTVVADTITLLTCHGVTAGDSVHLAVRNSPAFLAFWLACSRIGAWMVPVDPASSERDLRRQLDRVTPRLGICGGSRTVPYRAAARAHGLADVIELAETGADVDTIAAAAAALRAAHPATPQPDSFPFPMPADRIAVMFTSGTTSEPKGVILTQANYASLARTMSTVADLQARHRWLVTLPLFHGNAQYYCFAPAIAVGASVALTATFSASGWVNSAHELQATHASLFAAPIRMILARTPGNAPQLALEHVWFAQSLGADHHDQFAKLCGVIPRQLYGMTETVAIVTADMSEPPRHDVIGQPLPQRQVHLIDQTTRSEAAIGQPGMIHVAGRPGVDIFQGYLDAPEITDKAFTSIGDTDGQVWFATGDLATRDERGTLRFVGRADDVIKVAGENVSLTEVEATVAQAPGVLEVAVVAKPDAIRDVVPIAYVVPRDAAAPPSEAELFAWARMELAPAARPREWHLIDELPRTSVGKVRRFAISRDAS